MKAFTRLRRTAEADLEEWIRRVHKNEDMQERLQDIRARLGLPNEEAGSETLDLLEEAVEELELAYDLPFHWCEVIYQSLVTGKTFIPVPRTLPRAVTSLGRDGEAHEMIITPETDITNPLIVEYIQHWQRQHIEPIPRPEPVPGDPRKKDWRPVLEWRKRHPGYSHEQIAETLGYAAQTVRRKLAELESRTD